MVVIMLTSVEQSPTDYRLTFLAKASDSCSTGKKISAKIGNMHLCLPAKNTLLLMQLTYAWLLSAHDQIWVVLCHACPEPRRRKMRCSSTLPRLQQTRAATL